MQERGLKFVKRYLISHTLYVAPYAGAWIEIRLVILPCGVSEVAPYAGAWIEIYLQSI